MCSMTSADIAHTFFGLRLPITVSQLKSAFRIAAHELHPDVGGSNESFCALKEAYDTLIVSPEVLLGHTVARTHTYEGYPLSNLGLGLGPNTNGRPCDYCDSRGYTAQVQQKRCKRCAGVGRISTCPACRGSGKFTQRRSLRIVDCQRCGASGFTPTPHYSYTGGITCPSCNKDELSRLKI